MKQHRVVVARRGGPEVLQVIEEDLPEPQKGEVRVRVLAAGVSAYDLMFRRSGKLPGTPKVPFTLGEDVVGVVDKLGNGVTSFAVGQRVAGATFSIGVGGGYTEYICLPAQEWVPVPLDLDPAEVVCLVVNYLTAHAMLHQAAKVKRGESILVQGAAGGVGSALLDLGRQAGLQMYGTASKHNHDVVSGFGATPIDYRAEDFVKRIQHLTGDGVDVVFDPIGGGRQVMRSYKAVRRGGRLIWFGVASTKQSGLRVIPFTLLAIGLLKLFPDGKRLPTAPDLGKDHAGYKKTLSELIALLAAGSLTPIVAQRIPLCEAARAHELLERGRYAGKVVLVTDEG
ncbi:medium chain dehydrogenase/reductase family protein [Candidatus Bipolaricaulota bacterium]|nr:medium chain dehydrogenase/reductase family protein [Candidatus Bipolaricaulota bacterium]